jgi:hypothetical protein
VRLIAILAAVAAALLIAGCGGKTATRAQVIARGNGICTASLEAIRAVPPPSGNTPAALAAYLKKVQPIVEREASELSKLPRPTEQKATLDAFVAAFARTDRAYRQAAAAADRGDARGAAQALATLHSSRVASLARAYGLKDCTGTLASAA